MAVDGLERVPRTRGSVHPRVCGELTTTMTNGQYVRGSSPRVRGTLLAAGRFAGQQRFIPACAGNSRAGAGAASCGSVHPRVCGELFDFQPGRRFRRRFIPACAGNSRDPRTRRRAAPVHPRVCGELRERLVAAVQLGGSSPRVRGTPSRRSRRWAARRFIPACAGNSSPSPAACSRSSVHPRVCGELPEHQSPSSPTAGSSPRVRGTPTTPARRPLSPAVHPRVCGELGRGGSVGHVPRGSSPRVRGTLLIVLVGLHDVRFIPACAGNSSPSRRIRQQHSGSSPCA